VKAEKTVLIIIDGTEKVAKMAESIAAVLKGNAVTIKTVSEFTGTDILPVDLFFIGCETPEPASFGYLSELLKHINLAGRSCGVFSPGSEKAAAYLSGLLKDSEAALCSQALFPDSTDVSGWVKKVLAPAPVLEEQSRRNKHGTDAKP
jgi:hypothetical protein